MAGERTFFEFFAGGGMARAGLGPGWHCLLANDIDRVKADCYERFWGDAVVCSDVASLRSADLPGHADLVWASFPCQDLSLAGDWRGLGPRTAKGRTRSGTFWPFWNLVRELVEEGRTPRMVVLENVVGALTSNEGKDFSAILTAVTEAGYRAGALVINAELFVPQSRPRLFIVAARSDLPVASGLTSDRPEAPWHTSSLQTAYARLPAQVRRQWLWWHLPIPPARTRAFSDLIEQEPTGVCWDSVSETKRLLRMMSDINRSKVHVATQAGRRMIGGVYKRTRVHDGCKVQRAEVRFDDVSGCLRTPAGGSSRQRILIVEGEKVRSRLLSPREAARLMGLPDSYTMPTRYNDAYHLAGDGVVVPVVRYLAQNIIEPLLSNAVAETFAVAAGAISSAI